MIGAGGRVSGSHPAYKTKELTEHFELIEAKYVITQSKVVSTVADAAAACHILNFPNLPPRRPERGRVRRLFIMADPPRTRRIRLDHFRRGCQHRRENCGVW